MSPLHSHGSDSSSHPTRDPWDCLSQLGGSFDLTTPMCASTSELDTQFSPRSALSRLTMPHWLTGVSAPRRPDCAWASHLIGSCTCDSTLQEIRAHRDSLGPWNLSVSTVALFRCSLPLCPTTDGSRIIVEVSTNIGTSRSSSRHRKRCAGPDTSRLPHCTGPKTGITTSDREPRTNI